MGKGYINNHVGRINRTSMVSNKKLNKTYDTGDRSKDGSKPCDVAGSSVSDKKERIGN